MQLNAANFPRSATLAEIHLAAGDYVLSSALVGDVIVKFAGASFLVLWNDEHGPQQLMRMSDADAWRAARFVSEFGVAPIERKRPTLRGLQPVGT